MYACICTDVQVCANACISHVLNVYNVGGDQMTAARIRSSKRICCNSTRGVHRLEGFIPNIEDWHAKVCVLGVSIHVLQCIHVHTIMNILLYM